MNLEDLDDENDLFNSILRIEDNISRRKTADSHLRLSNLISSDFQHDNSDPYSDLHHEYEEETIRVDRKERNNVFQAFLEKRERKQQNKQPPSPPSPRFKNYNTSDSFPSNNLEYDDDRIFSNVVNNKPSKVEDSFIAESENFLEEISNLQKMTLDPKTVDKRKQTVSKLSDFKRKVPQKKEESLPKQSSNISSIRTSINLQPTLDHHFDSLIPNQSRYYEDDVDDMSFKKQLEERIRLRNENHRLGLKREDPTRPSQAKNVMKPDDLRKLITSVKKKGSSNENSSRAFCLAGLMDDVEKNQNMYNNGVKKLQTSADFSSSKKFSKSMLQTNKSIDTKANSNNSMNRSSSAKKVRFNPSDTENRSKSLSKKDSANSAQLKKNLGLINDSVFSSSTNSNKKPTNTNNVQQQSSTSSFRDLLAQRKGVTLPKEKPNNEKRPNPSIPSKPTNLNNSKIRGDSISSLQKNSKPKLAAEKAPSQLRESSNTYHSIIDNKRNNAYKAPSYSQKPESRVEKTTREKIASQFDHIEDDSDEDDDFLEAKRLMQRISKLRNFIGGDSSK